MSVRLCCVSVIGLCYILCIYSVLFRGAVFIPTQCIIIYAVVLPNTCSFRVKCDKDLYFEHIYFLLVVFVKALFKVFYFHTWAPITLGVVGVTSRNFTRGRGLRPGWSSGTNFTRGAPYKIWEGKKCPKFCAIFDNFRLWSQIFPDRIDKSKIGKVLDQPHFIPY